MVIAKSDKRPYLRPPGPAGFEATAVWGRPATAGGLGSKRGKNGGRPSGTLSPNTLNWQEVDLPPAASGTVHQNERKLTSCCLWGGEKEREDTPPLIPIRLHSEARGGLSPAKGGFP